MLRENNLVLEKTFEEAEIHFALKVLGNDKSPRLDGFNIEFVGSCWDIVRADFMKLVEDFWESSFLANCLDHTFIKLNSKKKGAEDIIDLRPISLIGSVYKIVSKVLSLGLKRVLRKITTQEQGLFEVIEDRWTSSTPGIVCNIDLSKAYAQLSWDFLDYVMVGMGLGWWLRMWIRRCESSTSFLVLINGSPADFFRSSCEIRLGNPLAPLLFLLVVEVLRRMISGANEIGFIEGLRVG